MVGPVPVSSIIQSYLTCSFPNAIFHSSNLPRLLIFDNNGRKEHQTYSQHTHTPPALFRAWWTSSFTTPLPFSGQSEQKERKAMWEWKSCVILPTATYHQFVYNYKMIYILKVNVHFSLIQLNTYNERKLKLPKYLCHILV